MNLHTLVSVILQGSLMLIVLAIGLQSKWGDATYALKRPGLLLRGFVAVNVIVPAVATVLCLLLPLPWLTKAAICLMAVSPLAPFAPGKMLKGGADTAFVDGLYIVLMLAAMIIVPVTIALLNNLAPEPVHVPYAKLAVLILTSVFVPLAIGLAISGRWPDFAKRAAPLARKIAFAIIIPLGVLFIIKSFGALMALVGDGTVVTISAVVASGIVGGHLLGGRSPQHRAAMAQAAATRHPGIAVLIARRNFDDPHVVMTIVLFLLISIILCAIYGVWERKAFSRANPAEAG